MLKDFRNFIARGNVVDLAVAVIIGGAFSGIVTSLVEDIITPGLLNPAMQAARVDRLEQLVWNGVRYGSFFAATLNFLVIALVLFGMVKVAKHLQKALDDDPDPAQKDPVPSTEARVLIEIRDLLKSRS